MAFSWAVILAWGKVRNSEFPHRHSKVLRASVRLVSRIKTDGLANADAHVAKKAKKERRRVGRMVLYEFEKGKLRREKGRLRGRGIYNFSRISGLILVKLDSSN